MTPRRTMPKVKKVQGEAPSATAKGRPDWIVVALALLGVGVAGYLTALKLGGNQAFLCRDGSGCDIVQASRRSADTRLNSSHGSISYAVFCLKKKKARRAVRLRRVRDRRRRLPKAHRVRR